MSQYHKAKTSSGTSRSPPVAFRGPTPATPCKSLKTKQPSTFPAFPAPFNLDKKLEEIFGPVNKSLPDGTAEEEFQRYVSGMLSPPEMDILRFWEVSFPYTIRDEHSQSR